LLKEFKVTQLFDTKWHLIIQSDPHIYHTVLQNYTGKFNLPFHTKIHDPP